MNANELEAMRRRLRARQAAEGEDNPFMVGFAVVMMFATGFLAMFL